MEDIAKFIMRDEEFDCVVCGNKVKPLGYTARDHCPHCLFSIHVDNNPGDRLCNCRGVLEPIDVEKFKTDSYKIVYKCQKCGMNKKNIMATDDNFDKVLDVMKNK